MPHSKRGGAPAAQLALVMTAVPVAPLPVETSGPTCHQQPAHGSSIHYGAAVANPHAGDHLVVMLIWSGKQHPGGQECEGAMCLLGVLCAGQDDVHITIIQCNRHACNMSHAQTTRHCMQASASSMPKEACHTLLLLVLTTTHVPSCCQ